MHKSTTQTTDQRIDSADVVIIGSGFAGLAAAIEAAETGASVIVIEKMKAPGGNSMISDGGIAAASTSFQKKAGIVDSPEMMYQDMANAGLNLNYPDLLRLVTEKSAEVFEWTVQYLGVEYLDRVDIFGGHSVPRCYTPVGVSGSQIIKRQLSKLRQLSIEIKTGICFKTFSQSENGKVNGVFVRAEYDYQNPDAGNDGYIEAKKAVILASGGFGSDVIFRSAQDPRLTQDIDTTNKPFATAEALKEALKLGAMPVHLSHIQLGPWASPDEKGYGVATAFADYIVFPYGIIIDPVTGKRIVNEIADRKTVADAILKIGHPCIGIADYMAVSNSGWSIDRCLKKGVVKQFNSLGDFAVSYEIPQQALSATVSRFNDYIKSNNDTEYNKPLLPETEPIASAPFFGVRLWPKVHHTMGGVRINTHAQVIDLDGNPIPGLYAAGEVVGGIHGACRLGSCAITDCLVFGRIAGQEAVTK